MKTLQDLEIKRVIISDEEKEKCILNIKVSD